MGMGVGGSTAEQAGFAAVPPNVRHGQGIGRQGTSLCRRGEASNRGRVRLILTFAQPVLRVRRHGGTVVCFAM
jgi:hypothetical protein